MDKFDSDIFFTKKNEKQKYRTVGTGPKSNRKTSQTETNSIPLAHT
jgi:hypothetical protein